MYEGKPERGVSWVGMKAIVRPSRDSGLITSIARVVLSCRVQWLGSPYAEATEATQGAKQLGSCELDNTWEMGRTAHGAPEIRR